MERIFKVNGKETTIEELKIGDVFEIYDTANGETIQFMDANGRSEWTVSKIPKTSEGKIAYVEVEEKVR